MSSKNGLISEQASSRPGLPYYVSKDEPLLNPSLISPVQLLSADLEAQAEIVCRGLNAGVPSPYTGAIKLLPGASSVGAAAEGLTVRSVGGGTQVEVGTDGETPNVLAIAGASGLSQVYDEIYNQPVALQPITLSATNPLCAPIPANVGEIFRCTQAGVAASAAAAIGTNFQVPKSGWYALQIEMSLGNAPAPAAPDINVPIVAIGGIDLGETLTWAITDGVVVEPYAVQEFVSQEFAASAIVQQGGNVIKEHVSMHLFQAGTTYTFSLRSSSALWNIGTNGRLKAELIAMC